VIAVAFSGLKIVNFPWRQNRPFWDLRSGQFGDISLGKLYSNHKGGEDPFPTPAHEPGSLTPAIIVEMKNEDRNLARDISALRK